MITAAFVIGGFLLICRGAPIYDIIGIAVIAIALLVHVL